MKNKNFIIVSHKFLTQPDDELVNFLNSKNTENVLHIMHSFSDAKDRKSYYRYYKNGKLLEEVFGNDYIKFPEIFIYLKELIFTIKTGYKFKFNWDIYVGMDGLCILYGNLFRAFRKINKIIYWSIDFVPYKRFNNELKNYIYHKVNIFGYKNSDELWDLSPRMHDAREKFLNMKITDYKKHKIVPYGVWWNRIKRISYDESEKHTLVFMGHILEKQGIQFVLYAIPEILNKIPDFKFKIIGTGNYLDKVRKIAKDLNIENSCRFMGKIDDHKLLQVEIAKSAAAIAPYSKEHDTWTYYADPGKIKEYLACGVPLITTDIPWNSFEITQKRCGVITNLSKEDLVKNITFILNPNVNKEYRKNAIEYAKSYDFDKIFIDLNI